MRLHRFYVNKPLGEEIVVENVEGEKELIHQWTHVFRYKSGDEVFLFSSSTPGNDFLYRISSLSKQAVTLALISSSVNIMPKQSITLVMALVKKDTFETIVRQATELGVTSVLPVIAARSEKKNLNFERLSAISKEAAEQSGRGSVPNILPIATFEEALALSVDKNNIIASLEEGLSLKEDSASDTKALFAWVGPEGGWTKEEEALAGDHRFTKVTLGKAVLKADTAAVALLSSLSSLIWRK